MKKKCSRNLYNDFRNKKVSKPNIAKDGDTFLNVKIIRNDSKEWKFWSKGMVEYVADHQELLSFDEAHNKHNKYINGSGKFINYLSRESAVHNNEHSKDQIWHYTNLKQYNGKEISSFSAISQKCRLELVNLDEVRKIHPKSHIWSIVLSEKDINMKDIMFQNQHKIADRVIRSLFDFPVDATIAFHGNTEHPHIHIMAYQPECMEYKDLRKVSTLKLKNIIDAKRSYYYFLSKNENYFNKLLEHKYKLRDYYTGETLIQTFKNDFVNLIFYLKNESETKIAFQYNRLNDYSKQLVNDIKQKMLTLPTNDEKLLAFQKAYRQFYDEGDKLVNKEFANLPQNKANSLKLELQKFNNEVEEKINQQILKTAKDFYFANKDIMSVFLSEARKNKKIVLDPRTNKRIINNSSKIINKTFEKIEEFKTFNTKNGYLPDEWIKQYYQEQNKSNKKKLKINFDLLNSISKENNKYHKPNYHPLEHYDPNENLTELKKLMFELKRKYYQQ